METQSGLKKLLPNVIAIIAFLAISAFFCMPALKGERLAPHDTVSWIYMSKEARDYYNTHGENPGWTNSMFSGMPASTIYVASKSNWIGNLGNKILMQPDNLLINPIAFFFFAMLSFFLLLKTLRVNTLISAIGAVAFAFASYNPIIIAAGHITKMVDLAYLPGLIAGIILVYRGKYFLGVAVTALFLGMFISIWHLQIIYYSLFVILAIALGFLAKAIKDKKVGHFIKASLVLLVAAACGVVANYIAIKGTSEYAKHSIRGGQTELTINKETNTQTKDGGLSKEYAFKWSNGIGETFCMLVPNLYGGQSGQNIGEDSKFGQTLSEIGVPQQQVEQMTSRAPTYWGPQPFLSGPMYFGAIVCFLFVLSLMVIKNPLKWWLAGAGFFFMALSWGNNFEGFNYFLFDHLPLYNKFRTPSMALSITAFIVAMLGFWGLYEFFNNKFTKAQLLSKLKMATYITGGLVLLIILASQFMMSFKGASDGQMEQSFGEHAGKLMKALRDDRASLALKDSFRSLVFILIAAAALWAFVKEKINGTVAVAIVGLACTIDLLGVAGRYLNKDNYADEFTIEQQYFSPRPVDAEIMKDKDPNFKVFDLSGDTYNDAKNSYFYKTIGGYHPAKMEIYQELIEMQLSKLNSSVLNMLNTKYIIVPAQQQGGQPQVIPNPNALGNAWFVSEIKYTKNADETMLALNAPAINDPKGDSAGTGFKPAQTAIVRESSRSAIGADKFVKDSSASIKLTKYELPRMTYESNNNNDGFGVFSEIYYPENWTAFVDGKQTPIVNVNYVLRGIKIPAGKHVIEFKFEDAAFKKAEQINLIGSILVTLLIVGAIAAYFLLRKKNIESPANDLLSE